jgi:hypothetical protein
MLDLTKLQTPRRPAGRRTVTGAPNRSGVPHQRLSLCTNCQLPSSAKGTSRVRRKAVAPLKLLRRPCVAARHAECRQPCPGRGEPLVAPRNRRATSVTPVAIYPTPGLALACCWRNYRHCLISLPYGPCYWPCTPKRFVQVSRLRQDGWVSH